MQEAYNTVRQESRIEFVVNKSRFIGWCYPVKTEAEALEKLEAIRKKHWDATHNCYAYAVGDRAETARFSDDGEPGGTAGMPMMEVLRQRGLTYVLVIATRYFGGVLLGAGGLVRAYSKTAADACTAAGQIAMKRTAFYGLTVDYPLWGRVESWLRTGGYPIHELEFLENVRVTALVPPGQEEAFCAGCVELTDGRITPTLLRQEYYGWEL